MLLSTAYFPPVAWFALAARGPFLLEACENYQKQSYRNRCYILASDGPQMLQVPVQHRTEVSHRDPIRAIAPEKGSLPGASLRDPIRAIAPEKGSLPGASLRDPIRANAPGREPSPESGAKSICEMLVDYSTPWVLRTQRALDTAYETSAFYEYYRDEVFALLDAKPATLWELNLSTIRWAFGALGVPCRLDETIDFVAESPEDYRFTLHPKKAAVLPEKPYYQVFRDRLECFTPGLSVMDLIFNEGPNALSTILP